jgi:cupin 2 domain-containing protein
MAHGNLFEGIPADLRAELVTVLRQGAGVRIERIVSRGQSSPPGFWYDQDEAELVLVLTGRARLLLEGEPERELRAGDWIDIPPHLRHRVTFTEPEQDTIWLAVFYRP